MVAEAAIHPNPLYLSRGAELVTTITPDSDNSNSRSVSRETVLQVADILDRRIARAERYHSGNRGSGDVDGGETSIANTEGTTVSASIRLCLVAEDAEVAGRSQHLPPLLKRSNSTTTAPPPSSSSSKAKAWAGVEAAVTQPCRGAALHLAEATTSIPQPEREEVMEEHQASATKSTSNSSSGSVVTLEASKINIRQGAFAIYTTTTTTTTTAGARAGTVAIIELAAHDSLGFRLGAERLVREIYINDSGRAFLPPLLRVTWSPLKELWPMRGHQYTAAHHASMFRTWGGFENLTQDLKAFGTTQIEVAHITDKDGHVADPAGMIEFSARLARLDMNVSFWWDVTSFSANLTRTEALLNAMPRVDSIFSPGGDGGVAYGPHVSVPLSDFVARMPAGYQVRQYPDICHSLGAQFAIPRWHEAYKATHGRQAINPMPQFSAHIVRLRSNGSTPTVGVGAYSEGVHDDLNKCIWSAMAQDNSLSVQDVVAQYARYHFGKHAEQMKVALLSLEQNWVGANGDLAANTGVLSTLSLLQQVEAAVSAREMEENWRLQTALYRGYYDAVVQARLRVDRSAAQAARAALADAPRAGSQKAIAAALNALKPNATRDDPIVAAWVARALALASALNSSVGAEVLQSQAVSLNVAGL
eukprot:UC1_evm1s2078